LASRADWIDFCFATMVFLNVVSFMSDMFLVLDWTHCCCGGAGEADFGESAGVFVPDELVEDGWLAVELRVLASFLLTRVR